MILNKPGESYTWGGKTFVIGEQVYATEESEYHGLIGVITEIRDGKDKETENYLPDIYCQLEDPVLDCDKEELEKRFSALYQCPKKLEDIGLDLVIMGPDMVMPMKALDEQKATIPVFHIYEDWAANGESGSSVIVTTDYDDAKRRFNKMLSEEMMDGVIPIARTKCGFTMEQRKDFYSCWVDGEYSESHYVLCIKEESAILSDRIAAQIGMKCRDAALRNEFYQQISEWDEVSDFTDEEMVQLIQSPELPGALREALDNHSSYWETYWDAISSKAYDLIQDFRKKLGKIKPSAEEESNTFPAVNELSKYPFFVKIKEEEFIAINATAEKHKNLFLAGDKYIIRPFKGWLDLLKEGGELHHAVAACAKYLYGTGMDYLFAMRKADEPEKPYITLEFFQDGRFSKGRMLNNHPVKDAEELAFIEEFRTRILLPYIKG